MTKKTKKEKEAANAKAKDIKHFNGGGDKVQWGGVAVDLAFASAAV